MKAITLNSAKSVGISNVSHPDKISDNELLIKVDFVTLCGSDLHYYNADALPYNLEYPVILGHEVSGTIVQLGKGCNEFVLGDFVAIDPNRPCLHCRYCERKEFNFCENLRYFASRGERGALVQYLVVNKKQAKVIDEKVFSKESGSLFEPLAVAYSAIKKVCPVDNEKILIIGGGAIGLLTGYLLENIYNNQNYSIVENNQHRIAAANCLDLLNKNVVNSNEVESDFDVLIDTSGSAPAIEYAVQNKLLNNSKAVLIGLSDSTINLSIKEVVYKGLQIHGSYRFNDIYDELIKNLTNDNFKKVITHSFSYLDAQTAFETALLPNSFKVQIKF